MTVSDGALASAALALALGLRHGLDPDHLAAIDGMTRFNMMGRRTFAPYCGALFSAGHGAAIVVAAILLALLASAWTPPTWLEPAGKILSATVLLLLGASNLLSVIKNRHDSRELHLLGVRNSLFVAVLRSSGPWQIVFVGILFALSFDALGLAVFFAGNATTLGAVASAAALSLVFAAGMVGVDAANGLWLSRLARRSDRTSGTASRAMTLAISLISLLLGAAIAGCCLWSAFDRWLSLHELGVSLLGMLVVLCVYLFARPLAPPG